METKLKQKEKVMRHMELMGSISSYAAFQLYHITRLSAVIFDLRKSGVPIISIRRKRNNADGSVTRWTEYRLDA